MIINEAKKILQELEIDMKIDNEQENLDKSKTIIIEQIPKEGIKVDKGSKIIVEY